MIMMQVEMSFPVQILPTHKPNTNEKVYCFLRPRIAALSLRGITKKGNALVGDDAKVSNVKQDFPAIITYYTLRRHYHNSHVLV